MDINNITVIGAGIMGHGIAQVSAQNGYHTTLIQLDQFLGRCLVNNGKWDILIINIAINSTHHTFGELENAVFFFGWYIRNDFGSYMLYQNSS